MYVSFEGSRHSYDYVVVFDLFIVSSDCHGSGHERDADLGPWPLFSTHPQQPRSLESAVEAACGQLSLLLFVFLTLVTTDHDQ